MWKEIKEFFGILLTFFSLIIIAILVFLDELGTKKEDVKASLIFLLSVAIAGCIFGSGGIKSLCCISLWLFYAFVCLSIIIYFLFLRSNQKEKEKEERK